MPPLYHFTHAANVPRILSERALLASRLAHTKRGIGDHSIKRARKSCFVRLGPGGVIADYVPFYFAPRSPMLYRLEANGTEGNGDGQRPLVYFVTSTERVVENGRSFVFTNMNARARKRDFSDDIAALDQYVDWELMRSEFWHNTAEFPDRKSRRQAEFLVHERLPLECILRIGVIDEGVARVIRHLLAGARLNLEVHVTPQWYFES